jgi:hypothetical protein
LLAFAGRACKRKWAAAGIADPMGEVQRITRGLGKAATAMLRDLASTIVDVPQARNRNIAIAAGS